MGCGNTKEASSPPAKREENNHHHHRKGSASSQVSVKKTRDPTPPPKDPTPPPDDNHGGHGDHGTRTYNLMDPGLFDPVPQQQQRDPTPPPKDPTPVPPSPPPKDPTPVPPPLPPQPPPNDDNDNLVKENEGDVTDPYGGEPVLDPQDDQKDEGPDDPLPEPEGEQIVNEEQPPANDTEGQGQAEYQGQGQDTSSNHGDEGQRPVKKDHGTAEGYVKSEYGIAEMFVEFRSNPEPLDKEYENEPTDLPYEDPDFGPSQAIKGENLEWKRPGEFREEPILFSSGTTRFDIGQGGAGTCWFLSTVAMLADKPELFHRVVPKDAWNKEGGYFFCRFWRFGEWETVYIDDRLPIVHGEHLWGARSADDPNEMWPALLEKAFARFHGSYNSVYGGQSGDAYLALTGGMSEYIDFDKALEDETSQGTKAKSLHCRLKNAIKSGGLITTEVPNEYDKQHGLVGGHAYSLTGASQVVNTSGQPVYLVRIRNPWGHTEWTGPWCDNGAEWSSLPKGELSHSQKDDGEFWMELKDFVRFFTGVTICSITPDFDQDGCDDTLNCCTTLFGNWEGETAAGFQNRIGNPKYSFYVDDEGMDSDGYVPLVVQICQKLKHRQKEKASIRVDLFQMLAEDSGNGVFVMKLLGKETNVYKKERQMSIRHKVEPGQYVVSPSTIDAGVEKDYLVRIFSPSGLQDIKNVPPGSSVMSGDDFEPPEVAGVDNKIRFCECKIGSWRANDNAGGQVSRDTFYLNPQVEFTIPDRGPQMVNITVMQSTRAKGNPVGTRLFELEDGYEITKEDGHRNYLYSHYEASPQSTDGDQNVFMNGSSATITYVLPPGKRYAAILHMDAENAENDFAVAVRSTCALNLKLHNF